MSPFVRRGDVIMRGKQNKNEKIYMYIVKSTAVKYHIYGF
jgi:hypothetical protein